MEVLQTSPLTTWVRRPARTIAVTSWPAKLARPPRTHQLCAVGRSFARHRAVLPTDLRRAMPILAHYQLHVAAPALGTVTEIAHDSVNELTVLLRLACAHPASGFAIHADGIPLPALERPGDLPDHIARVEDRKAVVAAGWIEAHEDHRP